MSAPFSSPASRGRWRDANTHRDGGGVRHQQRQRARRSRDGPFSCPERGAYLGASELVSGVASAPAGL